MRPLVILAMILALAAPAARADAPGWLRAAWPETDFSRSSIEFAEIVRGGPPRDGIPALTDPDFIPAADEDRLAPREPVMTIEIGGPARAYPIRYLMWHEIANDMVAGTPVAVTFCPLCNAAVAFDRRVDGRVLEFGVSGLLRNSDMIMYDRQQFGLWQQFTGAGIVGWSVGRTLAALPSRMESWASFRERRPDGLVMDEPEGWGRDYGRNPYVGYDGASWPFLYRGPAPPDGIAPLERVVRVQDRAWPLTRLAEAGEIVEAGVRLGWSVGQASALDAPRLGAGREVGDVTVTDADTGAPVVHEIVFAFVFAAFEPDGRWMTGR